jgi:hypothetical protein
MCKARKCHSTLCRGLVTVRQTPRLVLQLHMCITCVSSFVALEWTLSDASAAEAVRFYTLGDTRDDLLVHLRQHAQTGSLYI